MSSPVALYATQLPAPVTSAPLDNSSSPIISTVLLLRTPISPAEGTDSYHDAFGTFCLPSFPLSALDSGATTPIAAGFGFGMTAGVRTTTPMAEPGDKMPGESTTTATTPKAAARPEEMLLQALQRQQLTINSNGGIGKTNGSKSKRASSPHRNYTRQLVSYEDDALPSTQPDVAREATDDPVSSPSRRPRKVSFVLTTHHATSSSQQQREWCVTSVPVLSSRSANEDEFDRLLTHGRWAGVVATSSRAWSVWKETAQRCKEKGKKPATNYPQTPFFLISPRAASTFRSTVLEKAPIEWAPAPNKAFGAPANAKNQGADSEGNGAGQALGLYIVGWLQRRAGTSSSDRIAAASPSINVSASDSVTDRPLLVLQGDKSLSALPDVLKANGIPFETIKIYETCEDPSLEENLTRLEMFYTGLGLHAEQEEDQEGTILLDIKAAGDGESEGGEGALSLPKPLAAARPDWIVFFSPSGIDYSARHLRQLGWLPSPILPSSEGDVHAGQGFVNGDDTQDYPRYVALGPTTATHLRDTYGLLTPPHVDDASEAYSDRKSRPQDMVKKNMNNKQQRVCVYIATSTDPKGVREAIRIADKEDRVEKVASLTDGSTGINNNMA